ncbi:MAG: choice-of-anchor B family protein, partial [bacterium]
MPVYLFKTLAFISFVIFSSALLSQQDSYNVFQIGRWSLTDERYSDCWGYTDNKGREYALIGATHGTAIVNITDSTNIYPVSFISGPVSNWRDIKTWRNYAYVTTEGGDGIQIINLTLLPDSAILVATYRRSVDNAHNLFIDEHGFAYVCGATNRPSSSHGGLNILDLADP